MKCAIIRYFLSFVFVYFFLNITDAHSIVLDAILKFCLLSALYLSLWNHFTKIVSAKIEFSVSDKLDEANFKFEIKKKKFLWIFIISHWPMLFLKFKFFSFNSDVYIFFYHSNMFHNFDILVSSNSICYDSSYSRSTLAILTPVFYEIVRQNAGWYFRNVDKNKE